MRKELPRLFYCSVTLDYLEEEVVIENPYELVFLDENLRAIDECRYLVNDGDVDIVLEQFAQCSHRIRVRLKVRLAMRDNTTIFCFILLFSGQAKTFYIRLRYSFCRVVAGRVSRINKRTSALQLNWFLLRKAFMLFAMSKI